jgi:hypothetical protein
MEAQMVSEVSDRPACKRDSLFATVCQILKRTLDLEWYQIKCDATIVGRLGATPDQIHDSVIPELKRVIPGIDIQESFFSSDPTVRELVDSLGIQLVAA